MDNRNRQVPEKYLRRRRIFVLAVAILIIVIVALIAGLKGPKKDAKDKTNPSGSESQQSQSDEESGNKRNSRIVDEDSSSQSSSSEDEKTPADEEENTPEATSGEDPVDDLGTSEEELEDVLDTLGEAEGQKVVYSAMSNTPDVSPNQAPEKAKEVPKKTLASSQWNTILVNSSNPLPEDFSIETVEVCEHPVDKRMEEPLLKMLLAAKADGINLEIVSGYRSVETQTDVYNKKMKEYLDRGLSKKTATEYTEMYIQVPGQSEHHTGLAVDILTPTYTKLLPGYANTAAAKWLKENAAAYGFILRYPEGKEKITGISFEPWHYRYVGTTIAKEIMEKGYTLEEYFYIKEKETVAPSTQQTKEE